MTSRRVKGRVAGRRPAAVLALLTTALLAGCADEPRRPPHVLFITLDTLRADRLGCYGQSERDTTPHLDAFAEQAVLFEQAFSASSFTPPSHASLFTGLLPSEHGLTYWNRKLADVPTAAEVFAAAGYRTWACSPLRTLFVVGLQRGFQTTVELPARQEPGRVFLGDAAAVNAAALPVLTAADERPVFAWLHYYDAHRVFGRQGEEWAHRYNNSQPVEVGDTEGWYQLPPAARGDGHMTQADLTPEQTRFIADRYDGGLAYLDARLGELFAALDEAGVLDDTLVVITADHGEVFDEHAEEWFAHDPYLVEENVHVPLLVRLPGGAEGGRRVTALVSGVDVLPTLLSLAGVAPPAGRMSGMDLSHLVAGRPGPRREAVFAERQGRDRSGEAGVSEAAAAAERDERRMLRTATHKLIHSVDRGSFALYAVEDEQTDLLGTHAKEGQALLARYRQVLAGLSAAGATNSDLDAESEAYLRSLGYLGSGEDALLVEPAPTRDEDEPRRPPDAPPPDRDGR